MKVERRRMAGEELGSESVRQFECRAAEMSGSSSIRKWSIMQRRVRQRACSG